MDKNGINALITEIKDLSKDNYKDNFYLGRVVSPLPNLKVKTNNIVIDKDNILIDKWILDRHNQLETDTDSFTLSDNHTSTHMHTTINGNTGNQTLTHSHSHSYSHKHNSNTYVDSLKNDDIVVMLRTGDTFCIISKVVGI